MSACFLVSLDTYNDYDLLLEWDQAHATLYLFLEILVDI